MAETCVTWLDSVESRVKALEDRVFGQADKDALYPKGAKDQKQCIDTLAELNNQLSSATKDRRKIMGVMKRLHEVEQYLDPAYTDNLTLDPNAKADIILAEEDQIRQQAADLEKIKELTEVMDSEHIKVVPQMAGAFQELSKVHIEQQDKTVEFTEDVKQMLSTYNNIITLLSKQFVQWDETLTKMEAAKMVKKRDM